MPFVLAGGCISTTVVNIGQKSSLEKQLMGEIEPLSEDELLVASVRAPAGGSSGMQDDLTARAVAARRRQLFNRDDVDELKGVGCLGEDNQGRLVARVCEKAKDADVTALGSRIVSEENADRSAIIDWAISVDPVLTRADRPQVEAIYRRLMQERAKRGEWLQQPDGTWTQR